MIKIDFSGFEEYEWNHFHDVIYDVTFGNGDLNLNRDEMEKLFLELPYGMQLEACEFGMNDTVWRDNLWDWYKEHKTS